VPEIKGSSNIALLDWLPETKTLVVGFHNGTTYHHHDVPQSVYDALMASDSRGSEFHKLVKGKFKHSKVERDVADRQNT
jgi:hypothetical protein